MKISGRRRTKNRTRRSRPQTHLSSPLGSVHHCSSVITIIMSVPPGGPRSSSSFGLRNHHPMMVPTKLGFSSSSAGYTHSNNNSSMRAANYYHGNNNNHEIYNSRSLHPTMMMQPRAAGFGGDYPYHSMHTACGFNGDDGCDDDDYEVGDDYNNSNNAAMVSVGQAFPQPVFRRYAAAAGTTANRSSHYY